MTQKKLHLEEPWYGLQEKEAKRILSIYKKGFKDTIDGTFANTYPVASISYIAYGMGGLDVGADTPEHINTTERDILKEILIKYYRL